MYAESEQYYFSTKKKKKNQLGQCLRSTWNPLLTLTTFQFQNHSNTYLLEINLYLIS